MALIQAQFVSSSLLRSVPIEVVLPVDKLARPGKPQPEFKPYKTLYLLHGILGSCVDWVHGTRIQRWAEAHDLCVVMPSGDNSFYVDAPDGYHNYSSFILELVGVTRRMFHLSERREDTFIGGLSMGGYGALENGLKFHDTFGAIMAFSPALIFEPKNDLESTRPLFEACFGDLEEAKVSDLNPRLIAKRLVESNKDLPSIYIACGTEDKGILPNARSFAAYLDEIGYGHTYEEWSGAHEWDFWDSCIHRAMDWLPLGNGKAGISSGNVFAE